jgi:hypothetical protein
VADAGAIILNSSQRFLSISIIAIVICFLTIPLFSKLAIDYAYEPDFQDAQLASKWMNHYYENPKPELIVKFIRAQDKIGAISNERYLVYAGFLAGAFKHEPSIVKEVADLSATLHERSVGAVVLGITLSGTEQSRTFLAEMRERQSDRSSLIAQVRDSAVQDILDYPIEKNFPSPDMSIGFAADMFFGYYIATGDEAAISKLAQAMRWFADDEGDQINRYTAARSKSILTAMAAADPKALEICKKLSETDTGFVTGQLRMVVDFSPLSRRQVTQQ